MSTKKNTQEMNEFDEDLGFENLLNKFVSKWYWFVLSVAFCFGIAYYLAKKQTPIYLIVAKVMIADPKKGAPSAENQMLGNLGTNSGTAVENEAEILRTRYLMERVVRDLKLNITYYITGAIRDKELYAAPFIVDIVQPSDTISGAGLKLNFLPDSKIELESADFHGVIPYSKTVNIKGVGVIQILKTQTKPQYESTYAVSIGSVDGKVESLVGQMLVAVPNKTSSIIDITLNYPVPEKGEDILAKLINLYVKTNLDDRNRLADSSYAFIQNRLSYLGGELGDLEQNIQGFKQKNQITEISEQSSLLIANNSNFVNELAKVETQLSVLSSLQDYMRKNINGSSVVPSSLVVSDPLFESLVQKYNALLLERDRRLMSVTETNPIVVNLNQQISGTKNDMLASLSSSKNSLTITRNGLLARIRAAEGQVQNVPKTERNYLDLARQQKIKEELFIFLMQKGEETAISKTYNTPNSTNIDPPKSGVSPISPNKQIYYIAGIIIGLLIPAALIYLKYLVNTRVDSKDDITKRTRVPIVGEIGHNSEFDSLVVGNRSRSPIAEQFRALRTNLIWYLKQPSDKVILITSAVSGEGKSFASINLGNVLALSGKRVLLMELDLRKPNMSEKFGIFHDFGFTNYVKDHSVRAIDIVQRLAINENLFLISSGVLPSNPAEMLMSDRATELIDELRKLFDYIIIDAPPIGVVTDAQLLAVHADFCLYIVRQHFTKKTQLSILEDMNKNHRMKQLGVLVNDIKIEVGTGYSNSYGYNYGTYGTEEVDSKGKLTAMFSKSK
jgi:tyrosine-protein kinase Etk/Wzc